MAADAGVRAVTAVRTAGPVIHRAPAANPAGRIRAGKIGAKVTSAANVAVGAAEVVGVIATAVTKGPGRKASRAAEPFERPLSPDTSDLTSRDVSRDRELNAATR